MAVAVFGVVGGCTIIYDSDDLRPRRDAAVDATPIVDVNPTELGLSLVDPEEIVEGSGDGGSRPALVVITGSNITDDVQLTIAFDGGEGAPATAPKIVASAVWPTHDRIAVAVVVPVQTDLDDGESRRALFTAKQAGVSRDFPISITGLDELEPPTAVTRIDTRDLRPRYSRVHFASPIHFFGAKPARIHATASIEIAAVVDVDAEGRIGGAHGCDGGTGSTDGGCESAGGRSGKSKVVVGVSGGGGGFGAIGGSANNADGESGKGGTESGDPMLARLEFNAGEDGNRGNGGGGGGDGLAVGGGDGGGGGGVLELTAGGTFTVGTGGVARAAGARGKEGGLGGDGGSGSGGAILIRAGGGLTAAGEWLRAPGGAPVDTGGRGAIGRIRVDAPGATISDMAEPNAVRGPIWQPDAPLMVRAPELKLQLFGESRQYGLSLNGSMRMVQPTDGVFRVDDKVEPGLTKLCAVAAPTASPVLDETQNCIEIIYVPR